MLDIDCSSDQTGWPEKRLFLAVLYSAYHDLHSKCRHLKNAANKFFDSEERGFPNYITYFDVLDNIDISHQFMSKLNERLGKNILIKKIA